IADPVIPVERGSVVNELSLTGNIARDEAYALRSEVNGTVTKVHVADGAAVTKGQVLFTVKQDDPVKNIDVVAPEAGELSELAVVKGQMTTAGTELVKLTPARYHVLATVEPVQ